MLKAVFFDNDGVLVDTEALYYRATCDVLARRHVTLSEEMFVEQFLRQGRGAWFLLEEQGCPPEEIARLRDDRNRLYGEALEREAILIDDVEANVKRLHGSVSLGIVTSSRRDHFEAIHRRTGILPYFDFCLTREDYLRAKPDPAPYLAALERSGCLADECLVVEDSERGLRAAVTAGLRCIVVPRGMTRGGDFARAYAVRQDLRRAVDEIVNQLA